MHDMMGIMERPCALHDEALPPGTIKEAAMMEEKLRRVAPDRCLLAGALHRAKLKGHRTYRCGSVDNIFQPYASRSA